MKPSALMTAAGAALPLATATALFMASDASFVATEAERQKQHSDSVRDTLLIGGASAGLGLLLGGLDHPGTIGRGLLYGSALFLGAAFLPSGKR
jgi:hypothetical protein